MDTILSGGSTKVQTWFECIESISDFIASNHFSESMSDIIRILGLVHAYVFENFYFLNTAVENKIKILLI